jgi:DNA-binding transcriptional LysR family regulator
MSIARPWDDRIMQRIKLRDMRVVMAVAEYSSMGKAAARLAVSQPAVSKAIAAIEHTLGVPLFDRTYQGVEPTIYGRALLKWARACVDDLEQGVREIEFLADPSAGEITIGTTEAMTAGLVPAVIDRLSQRFPRLAFNVMQARTIADQYRDLRERTVDLVFGRIDSQELDDDVRVEKLFDDPLLVVAGASNKWARRRKIDPADLMNEPWCLPNFDGWVRSQIAESFRAKGLQMPRRTVASTSIQLFTALMATGRFLAFLSGSTMRLSGARLGLKVVPVDLPTSRGPVAVVTLRNRTVTPVVQLFIECAREVAKPLARGQ